MSNEVHRPMQAAPFLRIDPIVGPFVERSLEDPADPRSSKPSGVLTRGSEYALYKPVLRERTIAKVKETRLRARSSKPRGCLYTCRNLSASPQVPNR
jgi:hypothetical protein